MAHPQKILENAGLIDQVGIRFKLSTNQAMNAVLHPGHVGDGYRLEFCRTCKGMKNLNSCVICDLCEDIYHTSCVNLELHKIPPIATWVCKTCTWRRGLSYIPLCAAHHDPESNFGAEQMELDDSDIDEGEGQKRKLDIKTQKTPVRIGPQYQQAVTPWQGMALNKLKPCHFENEIGLTADQIRADLKRVEEKEREKWLEDTFEGVGIASKLGETWLKSKTVRD